MQVTVMAFLISFSKGWIYYEVLVNDIVNLQGVRALREGLELFYYYVYQQTPYDWTGESV